MAEKTEYQVQTKVSGALTTFSPFDRTHTHAQALGTLLIVKTHTAPSPLSTLPVSSQPHSLGETAPRLPGHHLLMIKPS